VVEADDTHKGAERCRWQRRSGVAVQREVVDPSVNWYVCHRQEGMRGQEGHSRMLKLFAHYSLPTLLDSFELRRSAVRPINLDMIKSVHTSRAAGEFSLFTLLTNTVFKIHYIMFKY
jgi:hypothetical protein